MIDKRTGRGNGIDQCTASAWRVAETATHKAITPRQKSEIPVSHRFSRAKTIVVLAAAALFLLEAAAIWSETVGTEPAAPGRQIPVETQENLTVAFLGDHGTSSDARRVLELLKTEGVDLILSQGDLGYDASPEAFERLLHETLGPDFPFFASLGNHDRRDWRRYRDLMKVRAERIPELMCEGEIGIKAACTYRGLFFITSAVKIFFFDAASFHADFMQDQLSQTASRWRICSWHMNQSAMQVGAKEDQVGWSVYEACRKGGAVIVTAHEHSYSRTHLISEFSDQPVVASFDAAEVDISPGQSLAIVSGLAGRSARPQHRYDDWWAATYTATQNAKPGALICRFNVEGQADRADCAFKAINGDQPDRFTLRAR